MRMGGSSRNTGALVGREPGEESERTEGDDTDNDIRIRAVVGFYG